MADRAAIRLHDRVEFWGAVAAAALDLMGCERRCGVKEYLTQAEAAEMLGYSRWTIRRAELRGELAATGRGRKKRFLVSDVKKFATSSYLQLPPATKKCK